MRLAKYPSVPWRVNGITIRYKFRGGGIFIKYRTLGSIAQTTGIVPPTIIYIQYIRRGGGGGGGGIHSIRHIGWKGWFIYPFTLKNSKLSNAISRLTCDWYRHLTATQRKLALGLSSAVTSASYLRNVFDGILWHRDVYRCMEWCGIM